MSAHRSGPYCHFGKGASKSAGAYARYILRPEAVLDDRPLSQRVLMDERSPIWVRNLPEYVTQGVVDPGELRLRLATYAEFTGELERHRHRGRGSGLEYYRATGSFAKELRPTPEQVQETVDNFLAIDFAKARVIASLHRNTGNYHVNLAILARDLDGRKLDLRQRYFRMDQLWAKVYLRSTEPDPAIRLQKFRLHLEKKREMRNFHAEVKTVMKEVRGMGYSITRSQAEAMIGKPERFADYRNDRLHPHVEDAVQLATQHLRLRELDQKIKAAPASAEAAELRSEYRSIQAKFGGLSWTGEQLGDLLHAYANDEVFKTQLRRLAGPHIYEPVKALFVERKLGGRLITGPGLELSL